MENLNIKRKTAIVIFSIIALLSVFMFRDNSVDAAGETLGSTADNDVQVSVLGASLKLSDSDNQTGKQSMRISIEVTNADKATGCAVELSLNGGTYTVATDESLYSGGCGVVSRNIYSKDTEGKSVVYSVVIKGIPKNYFASGIGVRGIAVKSGGEKVTVPTEGEENISKSVDGVFQYTANTGEQVGSEVWYGQNNQNGNNKAINLLKGPHTLTIFAREDGLLINQILLTATKYSIDSNHKMLDDSGNVSEGLKDVTDNREALVSS